jgi:hypothetical protein
VPTLLPGIESLVGYYTDHEYDTLVAVMAGAGAGSMYKSMNGARAMAVYGGGRLRTS